jgi:hypothetical protein
MRDRRPSRYRPIFIGLILLSLGGVGLMHVPPGTASGQLSAWASLGTAVGGLALALWGFAR